MRPFVTAVVLGLLALTGRGASAAQVTVEVGDFFFCSPSQPAGACETVITAGDIVTWTYNQGTEGHTVTHCGDSCSAPASSPLFDSGNLGPGQTYSFTFEAPGRYLYYCVFHPPFMQATVVVQAAQPTATEAPTPEPATPATTPTEGPSPAPTHTPGTSSTPSPPPSATPLLEEDDDGDGATFWLVIGGVILAAVLATGGVYAMWPRRAA
jgi:hypothetical protein